jgi:hypothetical protein
MRSTRIIDGTSEHTVATPPSYDEIAVRAYEIYMERAADQGTAMEDWLRAEQELLEEQLKSLTPASGRRRPLRHVTEHDLASK